MNTIQIMKRSGLLLLSIGVALCAAYGARQSPVMFDYIQSKARVSASKEAAKNALNGYNKARQSAELKALVPGELPTLELDPSTEERARSTLVATYLKTLSTHSGPHAGNLEIARQTWLSSETLASKVLLSKTSLSVPTPQARLLGWLGESGILFSLGILLIGGGAYLTRKAQQLGTQQSDTGSSETLDVSAVSVRLTELSQAVARLAESARLIKEPMLSDANELKARIETLELSHFQPIVEARYRLQTHIGLGAFADVFSPFSSGERNLNRAWSTLVDEHWSESLSALGRAAHALKRADESLQTALTSKNEG